MENNKDGLVDEYHQNGQLKESLIYKNDIKDGFFELYDENGDSKEKGIYKNGEIIE